jgi:hypothetical protein
MMARRSRRLWKALYLHDLQIPCNKSGEIPAFSDKQQKIGVLALATLGPICVSLWELDPLSISHCARSTNFPQDRAKPEEDRQR